MTTPRTLTLARDAHRAHLRALRVRDRAIQRAVREGASVRHVARETGLSSSQISRICNNHSGPQ